MNKNLSDTTKRRKRDMEENYTRIPMCTNRRVSAVRDAALPRYFNRSREKGLDIPPSHARLGFKTSGRAEVLSRQLLAFATSKTPNKAKFRALFRRFSGPSRQNDEPLFTPLDKWEQDSPQRTINP